MSTSPPADPPPSGMADLAREIEGPGDAEGDGPSVHHAPFIWKKHLALFLVTAASVFTTGALGDESIPEGSLRENLVAIVHSPAAILHGAQFAAALLVILLAHEFGHYFAARAHKVDATLPFFIPLPILSPFGTMGAVIKMRGVIRTRTALMDIGAAGPLAGLVFAVPLYIWGASHSTYVPLVDGSAGGAQLGESLALKLFDKLAGANPPPGMDVMLSPIAFAAWAGMFVTMINLIPAAQLDGGHVAYALFGKKQNDYARIVHRSMLAFFFVSIAGFVLRDFQSGMTTTQMGARFGAHVGSSLFWLVWFEVLGILGALGRSPDRNEQKNNRPELDARTRVIGLVLLLVFASIGREHGTPFLWITWFAALGLLLAMEVQSGSLRKSTLLDHPPTEDDANVPLGPVRRIIAIGTLIAFPLLFMPAPISL